MTSGGDGGVVRLVVVDDDPMVRAALRMMLGGDSGLAVVAEASDGEEALRVVPGADADVTIYDPTHSYTLSADDLHGLAGYSPFEGWPIQGRVKLTMSRGELIYADGEFQGQPGRGKFVAGQPIRM